MTASRYVRTTALMLLGFSVITVAFNYLVDPYLVIGSKRIQGFNEVKVDVGEHLNMTKAYHPLFNQWDTLLVGNSRIEMGLDPGHFCFQELGFKVYNMGLPGAGVRKQLEYALNVMYQQPIKRVFISVDFVDFLIPGDRKLPEKSIRFDTPTDRLQYTFDGSNNTDYSWNAITDHYRVLYSLDALFSSLRTTALQNPDNSTRDNSGFNPARDILKASEIEGVHAFFEQKMGVLRKKYNRPWQLRFADGTLPHDFEFLREFLVIAERQGVQVTLFTNPFHRNFWELMSANKLDKLYSEWLEKIKSIAAERKSGNVYLWDFSIDSPYIHEEVPPPDVKSGPLEWFWEPAHYRSELGDIMLNSLLAEHCSEHPVFGVQLQ